MWSGVSPPSVKQIKTGPEGRPETENISRFIKIVLIMMSRDWVGGLVVVLVVATLSQAQQQQQFYTVLAPDTIRPNNNYLVAISVEGTGGDLQVSKNRGRRREGQEVAIENTLNEETSVLLRERMSSK